MLWIEYCHSDDVPKEMLYTGYKIKKDRDGNTPSMLWRMYRDYENIPDVLLDDADDVI